MPLRASIDGVTIIAPALGEAEWDMLRDSVAQRGAKIILACCGAEGFMRRNHQGTQHFAHKPGSQQCDMKGETVQHLKAKADIVRACRNAGYEASTEIAGASWRADVLAQRGATRIAFEVQWSQLRLEDCLRRQARYAQDSVRGCWFFRRPPLSLQRDGSDGSPGLKASRDLPLFHLVANADGAFVVQLNNRLHPLEAFVEALLKGRIRYCDKAATRGTSKVRVVCMGMLCPHCGYPNVVYALDSRLKSDCGLVFHAPRAFPRDFVLQPFVQEGLADFRHTDEGRLLRLGELRTRGNDGLSQGCGHCDQALPFTAIAHAYQRILESGREDWLGQFWATLPSEGIYMSETPHWCYPPDGVEFCCG